MSYHIAKTGAGCVVVLLRIVLFWGSFTPCLFGPEILAFQFGPNLNCRRETTVQSKLTKSGSLGLDQIEPLFLFVSSVRTYFQIVQTSESITGCSGRLSSEPEPGRKPSKNKMSLSVRDDKRLLN